jgi:hypothetical protein
LSNWLERSREVDNTEGNHGAAPSIQPTPTFPPYLDGDLDKINSRIGGLVDDLQLKYSIAVMGYGTGQDHIMMMIRKFGDFEQPIPLDEQQAIRNSLYKDIGKEFPIKLEISDFAQEGYSSGKIEKIDKDRILIVNRLEKNGNSDDPVATFVGLTKDGRIYIHGNTEPQTFDKFEIGQEVRAWTSGLMLDSYPGQTTALKIEIMD